MNQTLDMILLRSYDVFCLNSYDPKFQQKMCDDYSVRYCCPTVTQPPPQPLLQPLPQPPPQPPPSAITGSSKSYTRSIYRK